MQTVSQAFLDALKGSVQTEVQVDAWYDGELISENVELLGGQVTVDTTRAVAGSASLTVGSEDSSLTPSDWDSPLNVMGSELHVRGRLVLPGDPEWLSLGWYRIDTSQASEWWQDYGTSGWVVRGMQIAAEASDRMAKLDEAAFLAPTQPAQLGSAVTEIKRLCQDANVPVEDLSGVTDAAIPASITYDQGRVAALQAIAALVGCKARMSPAGALQLYPATPGASVWTVTVNDETKAALLAWSRKNDRTGIYNGVVSSGVTSAGVQVQGSATITEGPLRWGGPFGMVPYQHNNPLLDSDDAATKDATSMLATLAAQRTTVVPVTLPWNPALEAGDVITVELPDRSLTGPVQSLVWPVTPGPMTGEVAVPQESLWGLS